VSERFASLNPRYGKLEPLVSSRFGLFLRWLLIVWLDLSF